MSERRIEMTWRCSGCGHANLGRHMRCERCGDPKDASERYEMPSDTRAAPTVTDPALLGLATAGPNWHCTYCGSHQRRGDGACAQCGAAQAEGRPVAGVPAVPRAGAWRGLPVDDADVLRKLRTPVRIAIGILGAVVFGCVAFVALAVWASRPRTVEAEVIGRRWERVVDVERYRVFEREAFREGIPAGAFDVRSLGTRHHHDEQILDGYDTEHYTERVQDGYDTEYYTEQVACGQDCTSTPETCSESCTPDENGFATCRTTCSGGGQSCTTRYCSEQRTRQVPRYRDEPRTRQVPRYHSEPRYAEYFAFKAWDWGPERRLVAAGGADEPRWPSDDEVHLGVGLAEGERERETRREVCSVTFGDEDGRTFLQPLPSAEALARFPAHSRHRLRVESNGAFRVLAPGEE